MSFYSFTSYIIHFKVNNAAKVRKILEYSKQFAKIFLYAVVCKVNVKSTNKCNYWLTLYFIKVWRFSRKKIKENDGRLENF